MTARFLQIHTLTSYSGVLLNRDDAGYAKRLEVGGATRTRVSSQCLKRHWRTFEGAGALGAIEDVEMATRSRHSLQLYVANPLLATGEFKAEHVDKVVRAVMTEVVGKPDGKSKDAIQSGQIVVLGHPELRFIRQVAEEILRSDEVLTATDKKQGAAIAKVLKERLKGDAKKNLGAIGNAAGLDAAMFGRMTTSDILARGDAAIHVAHAFTVHEESSEDDFFSAIDDLLEQVDDAQQGLGSGHIGNVELTSGLFYGYVVIDVPLLVSNLTGVSQRDWATADRELAAEVTRRLIRTIATVSPGAKLGSTAPYAHAHTVLVESGSAQPRSLANAFIRPVSKRDGIQGAYQALGHHVADLDTMYDDLVGDRVLAGLEIPEGLRDALRAQGDVHSLREVADWAAAQVLR